MNVQRQLLEIRAGAKMADRFPLPEGISLYLLPPDSPTRKISPSKRRLVVAIDHNQQISQPVKIIHAG